MHANSKLNTYNVNLKLEKIFTVAITLEENRGFETHTFLFKTKDSIRNLEAIMRYTQLGDDITDEMLKLGSEFHNLTEIGNNLAEAEGSKIIIVGKYLIRTYVDTVYC